MQGNQEKEGRISRSAKFSDKVKKALLSERMLAVARSVARGSVYFFAAFFLSRCELIFSSRPLGFALLCASNSNVAYVLGGCALGALTAGRLRWIYLSAYVATVLLRLFINFILTSPYPEKSDDAKDAILFSVADKLTRFTVRHKIKNLFISKKSAAVYPSVFDGSKKSFSDSIAVRALLAASCAFFAGLCTVIIGGFAYYDVFGLLFGAICAPAAAFIYSFLFEKRLKGSAAYELSLLIFLFSLTFASRNAGFLGISLGAFIAFSSLLFACKRKAPLLALIYAALLGLGLSFGMTVYFILSAGLLIALGNLIPQAALFSAATLSLLGAAHVGGASGVISMLPAVFAATMVYLFVSGELRAPKPKLSVSQKLAIRKKKNRDEAANQNLSVGNMIASQSRMEATEQKLRSMSASFGSLSEIFFNLSDRLKRPAMLDLRKICDEAFEKACRDCPKRDICRGLEYSVTLEVIGRLTSKLHTRGYAQIEDVPSYLRSRCERAPTIVEDINADCARLTEAALRGERNEIFALDYSAISKILTDTVESEFESYSCDMSASTAIYDYLTERGYAVQSAVVLTGRRKQVILGGICAEDMEKDATAMRRAFSQICATELSNARFEMKNSVEYAYFSARKKIRVHQASFCTSAEGEGKISGDSLRFFDTAQDLSYSLISDGMGSGTTAALTSNISAVFLEKMLGAGNKTKTSIRMLNDVLRSRASSSAAECSASIDLAEIDLIDGSVSFTKCGAAPSFVIRNSKIYKIGADSAPIGILESPDVHVTRFSLREGDLIIMVSDGAIVDMDDGAFIDFLSQNAEFGISPEKLTELIGANAKISGSRDDVSCVVMKILKNDKR